MAHKRRKRSSLQKTLHYLAIESRSALLCLIASIVVTVTGLLAAHASALSEAQTKVKIEGLTDTAQLTLASRTASQVIDPSYYTTLPDLVDEFSALTKTGPLETARLTGDFAPSRPFIFQGGYNDFESARDCLATAAWYEAGDDAAGQKSVIQVVLNRVSHPRFPKSVCAVVFQGWQRATGCQFSFTCDGSMQRRIPSQAAWGRARERAMAALSGSVDPVVGQATHFHADYVAPKWMSEMEPLAKVGAHIFYRWPGTRGSLSGAPARLREVANVSLDYADLDPNASTSAVLDAPSVFEPFDGDAVALTPRSLPVGGKSPRPNSGQSIYEELAGYSDTGDGALDSPASASPARSEGQDRDQTAALVVGSPAAKPEALAPTCDGIDRRGLGECAASAATGLEGLGSDAAETSALPAAE